MSITFDWYVSVKAIEDKDINLNICIYPSMYKYIALMSIEHIKTIRNLAAFVYSSFQWITIAYCERRLSIILMNGASTDMYIIAPTLVHLVDL